MGELDWIKQLATDVSEIRDTLGTHVQAESGVMQNLGAFQGRIEAVLNNVEKRLETGDKTLEIHDRRIVALEVQSIKFKAIMGVVAVGAATLSQLVPILWKSMVFIMHKI